MASIDLHLHEVETGWMAPVCALCGRKGKYVRSKRVVWSPWWVPLVVLLTGFLFLVPFVRWLFIGTALAADRAVTLHLPFCKRHRNHWRWRSWPLVAVLLVSVGLIGGGIVVNVAAREAEATTRIASLLMFAGGVLGLLLWGVLAMILPLTAIRIKDLAGTAFTLTGVCEAFCDAVAERRLDASRPGGAPFETSDYDERLRRRREGRFDDS